MKKIINSLAVSSLLIIIVCSTCASITAVAFGQRKDSASTKDAENAAKMPGVKIYRNTIHVNGINIFYLDAKTAGPTILCLHGRWGRAETWVDFIRHYGRQFRIIAPDQRGHGLSSKPVSKYTAEEMSADMIALLDSLRIDSILLVGHSMGGSIAGYMAAHYPNHIKALAILDKSAGGPEKPNTQPLETIPFVDPITKDWPLPFSTLTEAREFLRSKFESDFSYEYFMNSLVEDSGGIHMMFSSQAIAANIAYYENWFHLLPKIQCPVLLMRSGSHEAISNEDFARMRSLLKNCTAIEMSHPDHAVHLGNKQEFYRYFDAFLVKSNF